MKNTLRGKAFLFLLMLILSLTPTVTEAAWTTGALDAPKLFSNFYARAIAIDGSGNPHIAYGEDHLYYAYHNGSSWNYETVDSSPRVGQYASIAIDSSTGYVHISYYDWGNGNLKYATNATGSWVPETVDSSGDVGLYDSIALDPSDNVHIGYYDNTNKALKYTTNGPVHTLFINPPSSEGSVTPDCSTGCWYDSGTIVVLTATANAGYEFDYWIGCDSASGNVCTMTMDTNENVTAVYLTCSDPVKNADTSEYFTSIQGAYDDPDTVDGHTLWSQGYVFTEDLYIDRAISVTIEGGYDCTYSTVTGDTFLDGNMTISDGTLLIENFVIEQKQENSLLGPGLFQALFFNITLSLNNSLNYRLLKIT